MGLRKHKQDWEDLGNIDPLFAILSDPARRFGKWDIGEFFLTGDREITGVMESAIRLGYPLERGLALDFGCGVGRLTRALATRFQQSHGVDISENMIVRAKELNQSIPNCKFTVNTEEHLKCFDGDFFDMVYTNIVLQHLPSKALTNSYISEFIRILKKQGLLVFQLPSYVPLKNRLQPRRRLYGLLRTLGFSHKFCYKKLGLTPIRMNFIPEHEMAAFLTGLGAEVLEVQANSNLSRIYYVTK